MRKRKAQFCVRLVGGALLGFTALVMVFPGCSSIHWNKFNYTAKDSSRASGPPGAVWGDHLDADRELARSSGCLSCHEGIESPSMHGPGVYIGCVDCHGGNENVFLADGVPNERPYSRSYLDSMRRAHVQPAFPADWNGSANPENSYGLLNRERLEYVRFVNPGDLRAAHISCGGCHETHTHHVKFSIMAHSAMVPGAGTYNNGVLPSKSYILGEFYMPDGRPAKAEMEVTEEEKARGVLPSLMPYPRFNISQPGNVFRGLERGIANTRGLGTDAKVDGAVITVTKTRLNDPNLWFLGTNDLPGEYRSSGCTACHVIYANSERDVSGPYARFGSMGMSASLDPTIPKDESGHPISHRLTRQIPTSQCLSCHIHQGSGSIGTYAGVMWWDGETDGEQFYRADGSLKVGKELVGLHEVANETARSSVFTEQHRGPWSFRKVFKRDLAGQPIDRDGNVISFEDPAWAEKAVHLVDAHFLAGMHCIDCHTTQDSHGDGKLYGEMVNAIEIDCIDCHGTVKERPNLIPSGPPSSGYPLSEIITPSGQRWMEFQDDGRLIQRSKVEGGLEWVVPQLVDVVNPSNDQYNRKAAIAKTLQKGTHQFGDAGVPSDQLAHSNEKVTCYACHTSWATTCSGCHLAAQTNRRTELAHYYDEPTFVDVGYYSQGLRSDSLILGINGNVKGNRISPVRSASAVCVTVENGDRATVTSQQPTISTPGFNGTAFTPFPPHTVSTKDGQQCTSCHVSVNEDNNAKLSVLFNLGAHSTDFLGSFAYVARGAGGVAGVRVGEGWEPQPVIGSDFHKLTQPASHRAHLAAGRNLKEAHTHSSTQARDVEVRGEYLLVADGPGGLQVFDVANIANKDVAQRIISAPFSPLGHHTHVATRNAAAIVLPSSTPLDLDRVSDPANCEQPIHPMYRYAYVLDEVEGLILVDINTLFDGNPDNNFLERKVTFNPEGQLSGAHHGIFVGRYLYALTAEAIVIVDVDQPLEPVVVRELRQGLRGPRAIDVQFRYAAVVDSEGMKILDVTRLDQPELVADAFVSLGDARGIRMTRTYAYVAAGVDGIAIIDMQRMRQPRLLQLFDADGAITDATDVVTGMTNASLFAYVAGGRAGLQVIELWTPSRYPGCDGFSPPPDPVLVATYRSSSPILSIAGGAVRDRGVDESGNQMSVYGRLGSRPMNQEERQAFYLDARGEVYRVSDDASGYEEVR